MWIIKIGIILFSFINFSCGPKITEEEIKKVVELDPSFKSVLEKKKRIDEKVNSLENKFSLEKSEIEAKIELLKDELRNKKRKVEKEIREIRKELEPEINEVKNKIEKLNRELISLRKRYVGIEDMLKDTKNIIRKSQEINTPLKERKDWEEKIRVLEKEKEEIGKEIKLLREKINLYRLGLRILLTR